MADVSSLAKKSLRGFGMTSKAYQLLKQLFQRASRMSAGERTEFLNRECADDPELRQELENLLSKDTDATALPKPLKSTELVERISETRVGQTINQYAVTAKLGSGGMGTVYRAEDTTLGRPVALKFLPAHLVHDALFSKRFLREAKAAARLDHPNICTVYEVGRSESGPFISMALLEGETLRARIQRGPLPIQEALDHAVQIGRGLEAAHQKKVVHRDIKPENLMVVPPTTGTGESLVKILDFGVTHLAEQTALTVGASTPGTVHYMAPEQITGSDSDRRCDIWALGVVMYEMVSGRKPFRSDPAAIAQAILATEPEPLTAVRSDVPLELERIVNKCVAKKAEERYQDAADLLVDLRVLKGELGPRESKPLFTLPAKRSLSASLVGVAAVVAVAIGVDWWFGRLSKTPVEAPPQYKLMQITRDSGYTGQPALSRDGKLVTYMSDRGGGGVNLWVQQVTGGEPIQITRNQSNVANPSFSRDGNQIVYGGIPGKGAVYVIPALGGHARRLVDQGTHPRFSPNGESVAYSVGYGNAPRAVYLVSSRGGQRRRLELDIPWAVRPIWSPEGRHLLFVGSRDPVPGLGSSSIDGGLLPAWAEPPFI